MTSGPLTSIAEQLLADAKLLDAYAEANGLDAVDFSKESLSDLPLDMEKTRYSIIDRAQNLRRLAQGPRDLLFELLNHVRHQEMHKESRPVSNVLFLSSLLIWPTYISYTTIMCQSMCHQRATSPTQT